MFDLQVLAFASDVTRVFAFKLGRDASNRVYPGKRIQRPFHDTSHHSGQREQDSELRDAEYVSCRPAAVSVDKLKNTPDGDGTLLDSTLLIYGSPMGDSNLHNHKRVPFFMAGHANGAIKGGVHLKAPNGTPLANVMLSVLQSSDSTTWSASATARPHTVSSMASMMEAIQIKRKSYFEYEGAPVTAALNRTDCPRADAGAHLKTRNMPTQAALTFKAGENLK